MKKNNKKKYFGLVSKLGSFINKSQTEVKESTPQIEENEKKIEPEIPQKKEENKTFNLDIEDDDKADYDLNVEDDEEEEEEEEDDDNNEEKGEEGEEEKEKVNEKEKEKKEESKNNYSDNEKNIKAEDKNEKKEDKKEEIKEDKKEEKKDENIKEDKNGENTNEEKNEKKEDIKEEIKKVNREEKRNEEKVEKKEENIENKNEEKKVESMQEKKEEMKEEIKEDNKKPVKDEEQTENKNNNKTEKDVKVEENQNLINENNEEKPKEEKTTKKLKIKKKKIKKDAEGNPFKKKEKNTTKRYVNALLAKAEKELFKSEPAPSPKPIQKKIRERPKHKKILDNNIICHYYLKKGSDIHISEYDYFPIQKNKQKKHGSILSKLSIGIGLFKNKKKNINYTDYYLFIDEYFIYFSKDVAVFTTDQDKRRIGSVVSFFNIIKITSEREEDNDLFKIQLEIKRQNDKNKIKEFFIDMGNYNDLMTQFNEIKKEYDLSYELETK